MTDYATDNVTPAAPPAPTFVSPGFGLKPGIDYTKEIKHFGAPYTPVVGGGGKARPTSGLIFPR
jgi:hypothetical protein